VVAIISARSAEKNFGAPTFQLCPPFFDGIRGTTVKVKQF